MNLTKLSAYLEQFLALKRALAEADPHCNSQGHKLLRYKEKLLRSFLSFWQEQGCPWPIRASLALDWVAVGAHTQHPYRDQHRVLAVRAFLQQLRTFEPETEIPENIFRPRPRRRTPHIFSDQEVAGLMAATQRLRLFETFRPLTIYNLIGLLASTGLRIGEALRLKVADAQLAVDPPHLLIYETKFGKSRNVVLHPSTAAHLRKYLRERKNVLRRRSAESFFTSRLGKPLDYQTTRSTFLRLLKHAGIHSIPGQRAPTLHAFRHTFAVKRLTQWHREKRNVQELLPHLAVYLGHVGPENTYWYVTSTPELLQTAAARFDIHRSKGAGNQ